MGANEELLLGYIRCQMCRPSRADEPKRTSRAARSTTNVAVRGFEWRLDDVTYGQFEPKRKHPSPACVEFSPLGELPVFCPAGKPASVAEATMILTLESPSPRSANGFLSMAATWQRSR